MGQKHGNSQGRSGRVEQQCNKPYPHSKHNWNNKGVPSRCDGKPKRPKP